MICKTCGNGTKNEQSRSGSEILFFFLNLAHVQILKGVRYRMSLEVIAPRVFPPFIINMSSFLSSIITLIVVA